eukprot:13084896-Ditylum_brightwellii.AAC.1
MGITDLVDYFKQIELLDGLEKKKSETITVDDDSDKNDNKSKSSRSDNNTSKKNDKKMQKERLMGGTLGLMTRSTVSAIR